MASSSGSGKKSRSLRVGPALLPVSGSSSASFNNSVIRADMCYYCFDVLSSYLHGTEHPTNPPFPNDLYPLFVTWKIGREGHLRGCIGTFSEISLHDGLSEYAITSATRDSRFSPITVSELARLHCSVSLLIRFEDGRDYMDWQIGRHGIRIEFMNEKGHRKTATYLPEVAAEQGWNHVQAINSLLKKGGHRGPITEELRQSIKLTRYQSEKLSVSYAEYMAHSRQALTRGSSSNTNNRTTMLQENGYSSYSSSPDPSFSPIPSPYLRAPSSGVPTMNGHRHLGRSHAPYSTNRQSNNTGGGAGHYSHLPYPPPPRS